MKKPLRFILFAALLALASSALAGELSHLRIAVRSEVDRPFKGWGKAPLKSHGKVYYIMYIKLGNPGPGGARELIKPVDEMLLRKLLVAQLAKQGFREMKPNEKPDILLTVMYGRGFLDNPYMDGQRVDNDGVVNISAGDSTDHVAKARSSIYQAKLQNARLEKLFINITAWAYPDTTKKKQKPKMLWKTTVLVDEPAHRDLNQFMEKMLATAAPHFDHPIEDEEAIIQTKFPEGYVRVGEAKEVPEQGAKGK